MEIVIAITSIFVITAVIWLLNKLLPYQLCPICAGVSGTWLWMLTARLLGYEIDMRIPAMLMGGSVVGIAYQIEKRLPINHSPLLWKTLFIPVGFVATYGILSAWWSVSILLATFLIVLILRFTEQIKSSETTPEEQNPEVEELKKKSGQIYPA